MSSQMLSKSTELCLLLFVSSKHYVQMGEGWTAISRCLLARIHETIR